MKIEKLEIGDRIKFNYWGFMEGYILEILPTKFIVNFMYTSGHAKILHISKKDVICKLEPVFNSNESCFNQPKYKEIPIEKNDILEKELLDGIKRVCEVAKNAEYSINDLIINPPKYTETRTYCKECNTYLGGLSGCPKIDWVICEKCKNKSLLPEIPKSYKFEFLLKSHSFGYSNNKNSSIMEGSGVDEKGNYNYDLKLLAPDWVKLNKIYIVEIKEKI